MPVEILIVNDHCILSESIGFLLQSEPDFRVTGVAKNFQEAIELCSHKTPKVAIVSLDLFGSNGLTTIKRLGSHCSGMHVIALAAHVKRHIIIESMNAGAKGYVATTSSLDELLFAIKSVSHNQFYMCQAASAMLVEFSKKNKKPESNLPDFNLCDREKEVLILIADGLSSKEIGLKLHISPSTVDVHRRNIMNKIGLHKATDLTRYAIRNNLIQA